MHTPKILIFIQFVPHLHRAEIVRCCQNVIEAFKVTVVKAVVQPSWSFARLSKVVHNSINSYETKKDATVENLGGRLLFPCMLASLKAADHEALIILNWRVEGFWLLYWMFSCLEDIAKYGWPIFTSSVHCTSSTLAIITQGLHIGWYIQWPCYCSCKGMK